MKEVVAISLAVSLTVTVLTPKILGILRREFGTAISNDREQMMRQMMRGRRRVHHHLRRVNRGNQPPAGVNNMEGRNIA